MRWLSLSAALAAAMFLPAAAVADQVHLLNGDSLRGKVLSLDAKELKLESESLGEIKIAREKVASIDFVESKDVAPTLDPIDANTARLNREIADRELAEVRLEMESVKKQLNETSTRLADEGLDQAQRIELVRQCVSLESRRKALESREELLRLKGAGSVLASGVKAAKAKPSKNDDLVDQLRNLDPANMKAVEQAFPLLNSSPEAKKYFTDRVGGLISGDLNIEDVRNDAKKVVTELEGLKQDLGPQAGQALDGYLSLLKRFLRETETEDAKLKLEKSKTDLTEEKLKLQSPAELNDAIKKLNSELTPIKKPAPDTELKKK